jgi:hypothetical protein
MPNEPIAIPPALTPEEWAAMEISQLNDVSVRVRLPRIDVRDPYGIQHKVAAACLHNAPFGFTRADVQLLQKTWHEDDCGALYALYDHECKCDSHPDRIALRAIASKIAALLPPEE